MMNVIRSAGLAKPPSTPAAPAPTLTPAPVIRVQLAPARPLFSFITEARTPRKLQLFLIAIGVLTFAFWYTVSTKLAQSERTLELVGKETAPSIIAASGIGAKLAEAHRHAAAALLSSGGDATHYWQQYDADLDAASERIAAAAESVAQNPAARGSVLLILQKLPAYTTRIGQTRQLQGAERKVLIEEADHVLHAEILPACAELDLANFKRLNAEYIDCSASARWDSLLVVSLGFGLIGLLSWTQLYLNQHFRRFFNLPLAFATMLLCAFVLGISSTLATAHDHLRVAKVDAFDSVYALWKARAVARDADADQALYLLTQNRRDFESAYFSKMNELVNGPLSENTIANLDSRNATLIGGLLGSEAANITFSGERQAVVDTLRGFRQYQLEDAQIRQLEQGDKHAAAVDLCLKDNAFAEFDHGLEVTLNINQREFNSAIEQGFTNLSGMSSLTIATAIAVVALSWLGLRPRLNEYRV